MAFHIVTISSLLHLQCCTGMHWEWGMGNGEWGMGNGEGIILVDRFSGINVDPVSPHRKVKLKRMKPCDATRRDATRRDATRRDATRRDATRRDATRRDATRRDNTNRI